MLAPRGKILDRDGRVIVDNRAIVFAAAEPRSNQVGTSAGDCRSAGARLRRSFARDPADGFGSRPQIIIKDQLTRDEIAWIESHQDPSSYPEMQLIKAWRRQYPQDGFAAHVMGYVGEISESRAGFAAVHRISAGRHYRQRRTREGNTTTSCAAWTGSSVFWWTTWAANGKWRGTQDAVPGKDLRTTLDLGFAGGGRTGDGGKTRRRSGAGSAQRRGSGNGQPHPAFDPNKFTGRISRTDWNADFRMIPHKPLLNRAIQAQLAPGSTFKPIMAMAGLESGVIKEDTDFHCPGGASFYGHYFACHLKHGHGDITLHSAIAQSCDVYFYNVGNRLGIDRIAQYADLAGIGRKTGIDLPNETQGTMPSTSWKMRMSRQKWYAGETISVAIGQGAVTVSPLQLVSALGGLGVGGKWFKPHLLAGEAPVLLRQGHFDPGNLEQVISGMYGVVNEWGTGHAAQLPGIKVCGKTGTAQVAATEKTKGAKMHSALANNAWFVAYAPMENPEIAVVALFENGEESYNAVPIVRDVLKAYFDKKARQANHRSAYDARSKSHFPRPGSLPRRHFWASHSWRRCAIMRYVPFEISIGRCSMVTLGAVRLGSTADLQRH